ncbi:MAG TPA: autotransporter-associated beta strand repeat-containing protein, partial [Chthoniobacteraceae bacterium]|nr:autotransporter-associated beta strand repeat-containing protein [Chthoniobacteraceae bacterium]
LNAGTLKLGTANALPSGAGKGNVNIAGNNFGSTTGGTAPGTIPAPGVLDMGGFDQAINGLNSTTGGFVTNTPSTAANTTNTLHVGNNNASSSFDGVIQDGYAVAANSSTISPSFFNGGINLHKVGSGTLTLNGANTFSGTTVVDAGKLVVGGGVSGSLNGVVNVNAGTLGGSGSTTGGVTIGNGTGGSDAFIAPGNSTGTFTTTFSLSLLSDATYQFELNSTTALADKIVANGVSLNSSALFSFTDLGSAVLATNGSVVFTIIDNTSGSAISGQFANLPNGVRFTSNGNTYLPSYAGGTGNDLTLTVVPEPGTLSSLVGALAPLLGWSRYRRRNGR